MQTKRKLLMCVACICAALSLSAKKPSGNYTDDKKKFTSFFSSDNEAPKANQLVDSLYKKIGLDTLGLQRNVFFFAYKGYQYLLDQGALSNTKILTICDYSQSSAHKRLYVIDVAEGKLLYNTYVSHGKNSGEEFATSFSNSNNSHKSSLGFMVTGETYRGRAGFSLRFDGKEPGINDNVRNRGVVLHGSRYVNEQRIEDKGYVGRSFGCPAVPSEVYKDIIADIKDGSCFFNYSADMHYAMSSKIMNAQFEWPALKPMLAVNTLVAPASVNDSKGVTATRLSK
ncbi:murein L,D-transpeptidase catalytic domain family protein [Danxiaibacter flavus]|uniref:Murein L,D-transpeptidase catalytic domain family protein n=1 Tax=Danxiaibacter flavus TaxID=3049108 RepID=A0ABV3ZK07_9BACT|nr:murein L,D-transpeptidase catalytic domain family protein [Chitinophagaceae bacterium DXS]